MAVVPGAKGGPIKVLDEANDGVVEFSVPGSDNRGCVAKFVPSMSNYDYIVAAWGDNSFYTYNLAEKVWMILGLTPRCIGNDQQRIVYDDLRRPEFDVVDGEISSDYHFHLKRDVTWRMSNEYLRRYLWLRGARGIRVFYYEAMLEDTSLIRSLMEGRSHIVLKPEEGVPWYELDIREYNGGLLLQLHASVEAVTSEQCPEPSADGILWPGCQTPMTSQIADSIFEQHPPVYLDDRFLEKYEQSAYYDSMPYQVYDYWECGPSYGGQWSFTGCKRVGRNLIRVPMRELYKPKPEREILHAHKYAMGPGDIAHINMDEEHVVAKVQRLLDILLRLGDGLAVLGKVAGIKRSAFEWTGFDRRQVEAEHWRAYPELSRLAQVAPLDMTQQSFLARCKSLHEIWQRIPNGSLKLLLERAGCPKDKIKGLKSLKLLQVLLNINDLNFHKEAPDALISDDEPIDWHENNPALAPLFLNYNLRIADAHDAIDACLKTLESLGFDTAGINSGYGKALDFVMDRVIDSFTAITTAVEALARRQ